MDVLLILQYNIVEKHCGNAVGMQICLLRVQKSKKAGKKTAENRKQFERKQGQFFHFFDGKALKNTENERNMNKCKIFLQKNIDIAIILWYDNYVHISNIRANVFFLKKSPFGECRFHPHFCGCQREGVCSDIDKL